MRDRSDNPSHHEDVLPQSYNSHEFALSFHCNVNSDNDYRVLIFFQKLKPEEEQWPLSYANEPGSEGQPVL